MSESNRKGILTGLLRLLEGAQDSAVINVHFFHGGTSTFYLPQASQPAEYDPQSCEADVLETLQLEGHRMTTTELLTAMQRRGKEWGDTTVKTKLAEMIEAGAINNDPKARPRGYGLSGW